MSSFVLSSGALARAVSSVSFHIVAAPELLAGERAGLEVDIRRFTVTLIDDTASAKRAWDELMRNMAEVALVYNARGRVHAGVWLKDVEAITHTHSK